VEIEFNAAEQTKLTLEMKSLKKGLAKYGRILSVSKKAAKIL